MMPTLLELGLGFGGHCGMDSMRRGGEGFPGGQEAEEQAEERERAEQERPD